MKKPLLPVLWSALMLHPLISFAQFSWTTSTSGTTRTLYGVSSGDSNTITAVGDSGSIVRSTNNGLTWSNQAITTTKRLWAVSFSDANNGTAVGDSGFIIRTTNGGSNWTTQTSGTSDILIGVSFVDANIGTAVGASGTILRTTNGGANWTPQTSLPTASFNGVFFVDAMNGFAAAAAGVVRRTTNGGTNWDALLPGTVHPFRAVHFTDASTGFVVGGTGGPIVYRTINGGTNWSPISIAGGTQQLHAVVFKDSSNGIVTGLSGHIWRTTNAGIAWSKETNGVPLTPHYYGATYAGSNTVVVVGSGGTIIRGVLEPIRQMYATVPVGGVDTQLWGIQTTSPFAVTLIDSFGGVKAGSGLDFNPTNRKLYASTGFGDGGKLYTIDTVTAAATLIGATGYPAVPGLAFASNGSLFGAAASSNISFADILIKINQVTGAGTYVGGFGTLMGRTISGMDGIAFHPISGVLYGTAGYEIDSVNGHLFTIDTATGLASHLGVLRRVGTGDTLKSFLAGLTFDNAGALYGSLGGGDGRIIRIYLDSLGYEYLGLVRANHSVSDIAIPRNPVTGVSKAPEIVPTKFELFQNYPNPFNPTTTIGMQIAERGRVILKIYNMLGQQVATLVNEEMKPGTYEVTWHPIGQTSGVYLYRLQVGNFVETRKLLLLR
jgi:photosystem II stability/assembly factor-like uncharacterized protein